jgi:hypothetical protein
MNMKAIPTEYRGVRFRSKSEAILARCFDIAGWLWLYEPKSNFEGDQPILNVHSWDFLIENQSDFQILVEYKPTKPTNQYAENLISKVRNHHRCNEHDYPRDSVIVWGSPWLLPWEKAYKVSPVYTSLASHGFDFLWERQGDPLQHYHHDKLGDLGLTNQVALEAMLYRFDLTNQSSDFSIDLRGL